MDEGDDGEDEEIPRWLRSATGATSSRRPASRNSVYSVHHRSSIVAHGESGVLSRNSTTSPPPRPVSAFRPTPRPLRNGATISQSVGTAETATFDEVEGSKTSQQLLTSLHLMDDDDLDRQLGFVGQGGPIRPSPSPLQSTPTTSLGGTESTASRSMTSNLLLVPAHSANATRSSSSLERLKEQAGDPLEPTSTRGRHRLVRDLSERLGATLQELKVSTRLFEQEREKLLLTLSAKRKEAEAREEALVDILSSMGVSSARVERALMQATSQSHVPVFKADERVAEYSTRLEVGQATRPAAVREHEALLPESIREAMSEGIDGSSPRSSRLSIAEGLQRPIPTHSLSATQIGDLTPQSVTSPLPTTSVLDGSAAGSMSQPTARAAWGSGLVPWMGAGGGSKKARPSIQATSPAAVEADGYFSDGPESTTASRFATSPSPQQQRTVSRSSSISAVMAQVGDESEDDEDEEDRNNWTAPRGAFGLLGSLAWRRKKPVKSKKIKKRSTADASSEPGHLGSSASRGSRRPSQADLDSASIRSSRTGKSSISVFKQAENDEDEANGETVRVKPSVNRPQARYTLSGRDVISALYEAIGSAPPSPEQERKQPFLVTSELPKPDHFKAICLATRIMTSDAASILLDSGKATSQTVREKAMALIEGARQEGKTVREGTGAKGGRRSLKNKPLIKRGNSAIEDKDARAVLPVSATSPDGASTTATLSRALGKYKKPSHQVVEPNVTRLPHLFGFGSIPAAAPVVAKEKHTKEIIAKEQIKETPLVTELEPILAHDVKPPTLAMSARRLPFVATHLTARKRRNTLDSLGKVSEGEESSGDEFEVYGGKNLQMTSSSGQASARNDGTDDALLTDRYGFVYDATPADVRLLRRARKEATHAPACLTGIRVGVRARGGTDSQSDEDKDDGDLVGPDSEDDEDMPAIKGNDSDAASQRTVSSHKTAGTGGAVSATNGSLGLSHLAVTPSKPVIEASNLSAASQSSSQPGPTNPDQERLHFEGQETITVASKTSTKRPPSTSQTVKRLLGQLQTMHQGQQAIQQTEWDDFLRRRRAGSKEKGEATTAESKASGLASVVRRGSDVLGISSKTAGATFHKIDTAGLSEEEWHLGGLVGLSQMGTETKDYQDFTQMIQRGIPLVYRSKIWYECSGAMDLNEPGRYQELLLEHENEENLCTNQIDLDIGRTMPTNIYFAGDGPGVPKLRRLLVAFSWYNPRCGYCQGMNNLAATLLLTHATEEEAFWVLVSIIEKILPEEYYTSHLLVSQADQRVLMDLMDDILPRLSSHIRDLGVDLPAVTFAWFLSLYTDCLPVETLFRVWDVMFVEGMIVLFRIAVAIFIINEKELLETSSPSAFYSFVHSMTSHLFSVDRLIKVGSLS